MTEYRYYSNREIVHEDDFEEYDNILYDLCDDFCLIQVPDHIVDEGIEAVEEYIHESYS